MPKFLRSRSSKTAEERRLLQRLLPLARQTVGSNNHSGNYGASTSSLFAPVRARSTSAKTQTVILGHDAKHSTTRAYSVAAIRSPRINVPHAGRTPGRRAFAK